jgi:hypothetical protein
MMTRLAAALRGEVAATTVEAYRRAGAAAYQDMMDAEQLRAGLAASGAGLWDAGPGQSSQLLCTWNAFALQTLGDQLVEADYQADPRTAGFLPPVTAEQAAAFLGEVEHWSASARRAASDATYDVTAEIAVPAPLPAWVTVEPCPRAHLTAMLTAARAMRGGPGRFTACGRSGVLMTSRSGRAAQAPTPSILPPCTSSIRTARRGTSPPRWLTIPRRAAPTSRRAR